MQSKVAREPICLTGRGCPAEQHRIAKGRSCKQLSCQLNLFPAFPGTRILDFYSTSARDVKPYDRNAMLLRLPFEMRSKIMNHLYLPTIKVRLCQSCSVALEKTLTRCPTAPS